MSAPGKIKDVNADTAILRAEPLPRDVVEASQ